MAFEIEQREVEDVAVLAGRGRFVAGEPVELFRGALDKLLAAGTVRAVMDLRETSYIDSSALGCLVMAHRSFEEAGGKMTIFGLSSTQMELMVVTKLTTVFEIYDDEIDAVNACIPGRQPRKFDLLEFVRSNRAKGGTE